MNILGRLFSCLIVVVCSSCYSKSNMVTTLDLTQSLHACIIDDEKINCYVKSVKVLDLQGETFRSPIFFYADETLCALHSQGTIYFYDIQTGKLLSSFNHKGRGPKEYSSIFEASYRDSVICISDHPSLMNAKMYSLRGDYLDTIGLPEACSTRFFGDDGWVICFSDHSTKRFEIYKGDECVQNSIYEDYARDYPLQSYGTFIRINDYDVYMTPLSDTLYAVTEKGMNPYLVYNTGKYAVPFQDRGKLDTKGTHIEYTPGCIAGNLCFTVLHIGPDVFGKYEKFCEVWDMSTEKLLFKKPASKENPAPGFFLHEESIGDFQFWPSFCEGNRCYGFVEDMDTTYLVVMTVG